MTTFAETAAPLRRLFNRLDFAPEPRQRSLAALLAHWQSARAGRVVPQLTADGAAAFERTAFVFGVEPGTGEYRLLAGAAAAETILGHCPVGRPLAQAGHPRAAARLRRLFQTVRSAGEPVLAEFAERDESGGVSLVEVLAAPLSSDGASVDMILAGAASRPVVGAAGRPHAQAAQEGRAPPLIFALDGEQGLGARIAARLGSTPAPHEYRTFEDGEHKARPLCEVRERDVYVIDAPVADGRHSPNDRLCRLLFFIGAVRDAGAARVTAVVPYLPYARKDRQTKLNDPVTSRYVAQLFEAMGTDRLIGMEVHNLAAFQNAFRCDTEHLSANATFLRHFLPGIGEGPVAVVSPDLGGAKRAELFREALEAALGRPVDKAFMEKGRSMGRVSGDLFAGDVDGRHAIVIDDLISTGTTMARVAAACRARGAVRVSVAATHGLFTGGAQVLWREEAVDEVVVTDTVPLPALDPAMVRERLVVLESADLFAEAIGRFAAAPHG